MQLWIELLAFSRYASSPTHEQSYKMAFQHRRWPRSFLLLSRPAYIDSQSCTLSMQGPSKWKLIAYFLLVHIPKRFLLDCEARIFSRLRCTAESEVADG